MPEEQYLPTDPEEDLTLNPDFTIIRNDYRIRLVGEQSPLHAQASALVSSMYGSRGLDIADHTLSAVRPGRTGRSWVTLVASRGSDVLGTLKVGIHSGNSLLADSLYQPEVDALRAQGKRLCEVTRLALHPELSCREVMATLFQVTYILSSLVRQRTDLLVEVHPSHACFYGRTLGFQIVGPERICRRVGAPAVLIHLCLEFAKEQISRYAGASERRGNRNMYSLFMPAAEQDAVVRKLIGPVAAPLNI